MRAAVGGRDRVAIGMHEAVLEAEPAQRPFDGAVLAGLLHFADERGVDHRLLALDVGGEIILQAAGEVEHGLGRHFAVGVQQRRRRAPADFDAAEQIRLGARHPEQPRRIEFRGGAENLGVGLEAHLRAAPVGRAADHFELGHRLAALEALAIKGLPARDLDFGARRQRIDHRHADAVQAAGSLVGAAVELAAGVQHRHDDFERRLVLEFRMRIDRHAAAVVGDAEPAALLERDFDRLGVAGDRLVHGVVDHLGEQVMHGVGVGPADIHAGPSPDRLQSFKHLDRGGVVLALAGRSRISAASSVCGAVRRRRTGHRSCGLFFSGDSNWTFSTRRAWNKTGT